ncbi:MAG: hypothetical protein FJW30_02980 [Acidobacteria bacterium]|nr:hypothetical protein [Acidobacteriota bacterium]
MKLVFFLSIPLLAQTVHGPAIGYVVDAGAQLLPILGVPAAAHLGAPQPGAVKSADGDLILTASGQARRGATAFDGQWESLENRVFLNSDRTRALTGAGWEIRSALPIRKAAGSASRLVAILADESLVAWAADGRQEYRLAASIWWSIAVSAKGDVYAFDPAARALLRIDAHGVSSALSELDANVSALGIAGDLIVLADFDGHRLFQYSFADASLRSFDAPAEANTLRMLAGDKGLLLSSDPAKPLWLFDPSLADPLVVVPAASQGGDR